MHDLSPSMEEFNSSTQTLGAWRERRALLTVKAHGFLFAPISSPLSFENLTGSNWLIWALGPEYNSLLHWHLGSSIHQLPGTFGGKSVHGEVEEALGASDMGTSFFFSKICFIDYI